MPEGHLVHRYARDQREALAGRRITATSPQGRFTNGARLLDGGVLREVDAHGKHLFYEWDARPIVHVHLGNTGLYLRHDATAPAPRPQVRLRFAAPDVAFDLIAPLVCEIIDAHTRRTIVSRLGPDPLRDDADRDLATRAVSAAGAPIGALLLDQSVISGVGNVLRAEVLNIRGLHPQRPGSTLSRAELDGLWEELVRVMRAARDEGVIRTRSGPASGTGRRAEAEARFVYDRDGCGRCATALTTLRLGGRPIAFCPRCQPSTRATELAAL